tara:strand:+ start:709 stop:1182 length:474 start_codon:yes stop_codon:yes gene_type:complete
MTDKNAIKHILETIDHIEQLKGSHNKNSFLNDIETVNDVVKKLKIISKTTSLISKALKKKYPDYPWSILYSLGFPNRLYGLDTLWGAILNRYYLDKVKYESLFDLRNLLEKVLIAEFVLLNKDNKPMTIKPKPKKKHLNQNNNKSIWPVKNRTNRLS